MVPIYQLNNSMIPIHYFLTINEHDTIREALKLMRESFHKGSAWQGPQMLIVLNNLEQPVGLLTLKSLLRATKLKQLVGDTSFKSEYVSWYYIKKSLELGIVVREVMRPVKAYSINYRDFNIHTATLIFTRNGINFIPIIDDEKIIGIVDKSSVFYELQSSSNSLPDRVAIFKTLAILKYLKNLKTNMSILFLGLLVRYKKGI
ncbi:MAG: magnesium transporter [Desulfosporosinus sp. BRH_c37]|nr:MAG: magnesium transporter [Desulfosporosinus sp. BRH_c37]